MKQFSLCTLGLLGTILFGVALAEPPQVQLLGVLGKQALLSIDGQQTLVKLGQTTAEVTLLEINTDTVKVEFDGQIQRLKLGAPVSTQFSTASLVREQVFRDSIGMYQTVGSINDSPVRFLIDTGATFIGINSVLAKRIGIDYRRGKPEQVSTAAGMVKAYHVKLDTVSVGRISLRNVDAFVLDGGEPDIPLLGMSFLGRLTVQQKGNVMTLEQRR